MKSVNKTTKHVVLISYDAFSEDNWEKAKSMPNLSKLLKKGAFSKKLKSVYPTLTYVAHATMVTGVYPDKHGIFHNNPLQPFVKEEDMDWFWYRKDLQAPTIYDAVMEKGMTTAAILWPVTGKASIKYNIPEIKAVRSENQALKIIKNGSPLFSIHMETKYGRYRRGIQQPYLDDFTTMIAVDTIKSKKPNLLLVHLIDLDDAKHENGTESLEVEEAIMRMDKRLGGIHKAVEDAGILKDTVFIVIGDHGQLNVRYELRLNPLLLEAGLIYEEDGKLNWRAYVQGAGGSAYLHIKEGDEEARVLALALIERLMKEECYGIEAIYTRSELDHLHVDQQFEYMLEAKEGYCFEDDVEGLPVTDLVEKGSKRANHGYSPKKAGYRCNLVISGEQIKKEYDIGDIDMVDIAPTIAKILEVDMDHCDGRVLNEILISN